ncbi:structural protein [Magnetospirillum sp. 15-1]|uniref:structural protein n=1 Tax=Magnetospirillum sp. 15-1 TaxID=1979370 RepID=UPI000BBC3F57|nr:structural protein [Magnetospirillum sp. 15-1]
MTKTCTLPRGIRLNNPGNIKEFPGDKTQWLGERTTDDDPVFEEFVSPEAGIRALARILLNYRRHHGLNTVASIITRWAPGCENDTGAYIAHVAARLGVTPSQIIDVTRPEIMADLVEAIIRHENGQQPYAREVILAGVDMGLERA